ncbi:FAD-binding oxidoreductase [Donghicola sp.]|jgi:glycine/D-amino acid oxidase-like deaminating enzyme|uniref:NAD(P)/FAD-dependent oxidoreductase n=1 Tax=Donghicola sp. TaxID=1929294 RepID=UPI0025F6341C|nr:FAD-dependent oxidoreductase [Donghicola sp.]MCT4575779.1 FAD-binding oxidoreductase [Donghicola sp.]
MAGILSNLFRRNSRKPAIYDFAIVGGGIAGLSAAAALAPLGSVVILEAERQLAYHASGRSSEMFLPHHGSKAVRVLTEASTTHLHFANGGVLRKRGMLLLGRAGEEQYFDYEMRAGNLSPIPIEDAGVYFPLMNQGTVSRAAWSNDALDMDVHSLIKGYADQARADGAELRPNTQVLGMTQTSEGWEIASADSVVRSRFVINAAGAWADVIAGLAGLPPLGLACLRQSMIDLPSPAGHDVRRWPYVRAAGGRWYAKPTGNGMLLSCGEEEPVMPTDSAPDESVLAHGLARFEDMTTLSVTRVNNTWSGLRTFAADRSPVVGADPLNPSFIWLAGQGGTGFQTAPALSDLLADLISGRASSLPTETVFAISPDRLRG